MNGIAKWNCVALREHEKLLHSLTDTEFVYKRTPVFPSALANHLRHDLDHYLSFFKGLHEDFIDYEARSREPNLETCRGRAIEVVENLYTELEVLSVDDDHPVKVRVEEDERMVLTNSTVRRELDFLLSHTIHHQAIISMMVRDMGRETTSTYGIAPSTLRHIRKTSCAQ